MSSTRRSNSRPRRTQITSPAPTTESILVVATNEAGVAPVQARLRDFGVLDSQVTAPTETRRLVLAPVDDGGVAAALRDDGQIAVTRPARDGPLRAWMEHTRPITFGNRLGVCFAWSEHEPPAVEHLVEIGPGGWGGRHPTTQLVIEQLVARIHGGERVLDVGCGSGVLGLCALALGAARVTAVDVKDSARDAARRNAALNGMQAALEVAPGSVDDVAGAFDVVVANIGRAALVFLAPDLTRLVAPSGWLAASGFAASQCSDLASALRPLVEAERRTMEDWSVLVLTPSAEITAGRRR